MPQIETEDLIKEYYQRVKHLYPNVDEKHFMELCKNPFNFIAAQMEKDELPTIHIKYFGKFKVTVSKVENLIRDLEKKSKFGDISPEKYERKRTAYEKILIRLRNEEQDEQADDKAGDNVEAIQEDT